MKASLQIQLIILVLLSSCLPSVKNTTFRSHPLKMNTLKSTIGLLQTNGCFYSIITSNKNIIPKDYFIYFFLYDNGIARQGSFWSETELSNERDSVIKYIENDCEVYKKYGGSPNFGGFSVLERKITIQIMLYVPQLHWENINWEGAIINNNTINIDTCLFQTNPLICKDNSLRKVRHGLTLFE